MGGREGVSPATTPPVPGVGGAGSYRLVGAFAPRGLSEGDDGALVADSVSSDGPSAAVARFVLR